MLAVKICFKTWFVEIRCLIEVNYSIKAVRLLTVILIGQSYNTTCTILKE